jgi:hypothetical protein
MVASISAAPPPTPPAAFVPLAEEPPPPPPTRVTSVETTPAGTTNVDAVYQLFVEHGPVEPLTVSV